MEPWEALDLDDSDLPSFLRPCERQVHDQSFNSTTTAISQPTLKPCSRLSLQLQSNYQEPSSNSFSQKSDSHSQRFVTELEPSLQPSTSSHLIPGPAGAVQAAMQRRTRGDRSFFFSEEEIVPTQEYIRRVVENGDSHDDDFASNPWICASDFVRGEGTTLSSLKNGFRADKVDLVVAMIKSCTPNGRGDLMVTLKDPTGSMEASIHRGVIADGELGKDVSVGAVLVLQKVAMFSASRTAHYLNITSNNVLKVISKDSGPTMKQNHPASTIKLLAPVTENHESWMQQNVFSKSQQRTEGIINNLRKISNLTNAQNDKIKDESNAEAEVSCFEDGNNQNHQAEEKLPLMNQQKANEVTKMAFSKGSIDEDQDIMILERHNHFKDAEGGSKTGKTQENNELPNLPDDQEEDEAERINLVQKTKEPLVSRTSLVPEWTDEQLDELLLFD